MVYVIQGGGGKNFNPALEFGQVYVMFPDGVMDVSPSKLLTIIEEEMEEFDPDKDHIVLTGDPMTIALVGYVILSKGFDKVSFLKWDNYTKKYRKVCV